MLEMELPLKSLRVKFVSDNHVVALLRHRLKIDFSSFDELSKGLIETVRLTS